MELLADNDINQVNGALAWTTPALIALADSGSLGPLAWSFGIGYGIGTLIYRTFLY